MHRFVVNAEEGSRLGLRDLCERFVNDVWVPHDLTEEQAAAFAWIISGVRYSRRQR